MELDVHYWEVMKRQVPARGTTSVAPIVLAATLLALWCRRAGLANPTQAQAAAVLSTINVTDQNASRGIQRATWLQNRRGQIVLNPAEVSKAIRLMRCFCSKQWDEWTKPAAKV